ncbi:hypothetical protein IW262DRAFT_1384373 [Armillaria fumosa]|nr:hypothetical protein IW262DRAFT_1384373 [Armillaria fumosa]
MLFSIFFFTPLAAFVCGVPTSLRVTLADDLVSNITVTMTVYTLAIIVSNSRVVEISLDRVAMSAGVNGTEYLSFDHTFEDPVVIPILGTVDSGDIADVQLTQGGPGTLTILSSKSLDLLNLDVDMRVATINEKLGITSNETGLTQSNVPVMCVSSFLHFTILVG